MRSNIMRGERLEEVPTGLKHKPIFVLRKTKTTDLPNQNDSDVIGFSIGKAQWCGNDSFAPSVKVWRDVQTDVGFKVSRESEETTLTRALDLATLVVYIYNHYANKKELDSQIIQTIGSNELLQQMKDYLSQENLSEIKKHIDVLKKAIKQIKGE